MFWLYSTLVHLAALAALPVVLLKSLREPDLRRHLGERLGGSPAFPGASPSPLWFQAVSVGEVQVARRILEEIFTLLPEAPILLSSTTPAGRRLAARSVREGWRACFFPLDAAWAVRRSLRRVRPGALVLVETELWPSLLRECSRARIPAIVANGRISPRSFPRYRLARTLIAPALARVSLFCMQSEEDAERIRLLGAPRDRIEVCGNVKWDLPEPPADSGAIRRELGFPAEAPVLVAGSTSEGEEEAVLEAWAILRPDFPALRLILAPRHPHRFDRVANLLSGRRIPFGRRSLGMAEDQPVLLLDTVGELSRIYAAGTVCFVGGSLVPRGGQNLMEPAAAGRPVLFGPGTENFREAARLLLSTGGGFRVADSASLAAGIRPLLSDPAAADRAGRSARRLVEKNRGAARRTAERIAGMLRRREA